MATDIGPRIGIDGEAEFRKELQNINNQLKTLGTEMKTVTSAFEGNEKSVEALAAQNTVLAREIGTQEQALARLRQGLIQSTAKYGELDDKTLKWQQAVNNATTNLNKLKTQLNKNEQEMDKASQGADELGDSMDKAGKAAEDSGGKFSAATVAIGNLAASAIESAISAVGNLVSSLVNLDESTEEFRVAQGRLNTAFEAAGMDAEAAEKAYTGFYTVLGDTDRATEASQLLAKLTESEQDLTKWTEIAAGVNGTFGDSLPIESLIEATNETVKVGEVTGTLADALNWAGINEDEFNEKLAACSDESERNQLIMETLGDTYDDAAKKFAKNNDTLIAARNAQVTMDKSLSELGGTVSSIKTQISSQLTPSLAGLATAFSDILSGNEAGGVKMGIAVQSLVESIAAGIPQAVSVGGQILNGLREGIVRSVPALVSAGGQLVLDLAESILTEAPRMVQSGLSMLDELTSGLIEGIPQMVSRLPEVVESILSYIDEQLPSILESGVTILQNLVDGITSAIPEIAKKLPEVIRSITQFLADNGPEILKSGVAIVGSLISGIISAIPELVLSLPKIASAIVSGLADMGGQFVEAGKDIIEGLWNGISDMAGWIAEKIQGFGEGVLNALKDFFGIASPSKVFESEVGKYMAQGIGVGFEDEMRRVSGQMQSAIPTPTVETVQNAAAGMVNGLAAANQGVNFPSTIVLTLENGAEIARWLLPYNRMASRANPEVVSGV